MSQINGCAFCLRLHSGIARRMGINEMQLDTLAGWRESGTFSQQERAALGLAEAVTRVEGDSHHVDEETWTSTRSEFNDDRVGPRYCSWSD